MVFGIQVIGIVFSIGLLYFTFLNYKRNEMNSAEFVFWEALWLLFAYVVLFPYSLGFIADTLHLVRLMDLFTISALMFLVVLTYYNYTINMKMRKKIEQIVRAVALRKK